MGFCKQRNAHPNTHIEVHTGILMIGLFTIGVDLEDIGGGLLKHILQFWGADLCGFGEKIM